MVYEDPRQKQKEMIEKREPTMIYEFEADTLKDIARKGNLVFHIYMHHNVDPNEVRSELDKMTPNIGYGHYFSFSSELHCTTDRDTYESLFNGTVEFDPSMGCKDGWTHGGYKEKQAAQVPESLKDKVAKISLYYEHRVYAL